MAGSWLQIRVDLLSGGAVELDPTPGRVLIVGSSHTFSALADAINSSFGRWDISHLHAFELAGGRQIGFADEEDPGFEDHAAVRVADAVAPGDEFSFVFDFGDRWLHRCRVLLERLDPREEFGPGPLPERPVPTIGWGWIPDQYGHESAEELELDDG